LKHFTLLFLSIVFFFTPNLVQSQHEFAPLGAEWQYDALFGWQGPGVSHVKVTGETTIGDQAYKIIEDKAISFENGEFIDIRYVRQDGFDIYEYLEYSEEEIFLFKTYMEVGDTINFPRLSGFDFFIVTEVNTLEVNDMEIREHVVQNISTPSFSVKIYDRLGPEYGMFFYWLSAPSDGNDLYLRCYRDNEIGQADISEVDCDEGISTSLYNIENEIKIFPNPANDHVMIDAGTNMIADGIIYLTNITGKVFPMRMYDNKIDITSLLPGIYIASVSVSNNPIYFQFVKL